MSRRFGLSLACAVSIASVPGAASAADTPRPPQDPNEKVCETVTSIGSRLATKRVCATRAEWAEKRKQERDFASDIQRGIGGNRCAEGTGDARKGVPSC
jgi:hypothetical protein